MPGGPTKTDPNSMDIKQIENKLMEEINAQSDANCKVYVGKTIEAYSQVNPFQFIFCFGSLHSDF